MKILVTGSAGFIGTHLCRELRNHGHKVVEVDHHGVGVHPHDLRVPGVASALVHLHRPEIVVHLAAKVGRQFGEDNPMATVIDNVGMTSLVAQACGRYGARLVYASTSEIYGDNGDTSCDEVDGPFALPHNLYGLTKHQGEAVCKLYAPVGFTALRFSMPYGPGLPAGRGRAAIINMLHQALHGYPIPVHEGAERSWCWIGDTVRAARLVIENTHGGAFNVGRDDQPISMKHVAMAACELTDAPFDLVEMVPAPERQTVVKRLSTERIRQLGWTPEVALREGMKRTLPWVESLYADGSVPGPLVGQRYA